MIIVNRSTVEGEKINTSYHKYPLKLLYPNRNIRYWMLKTKKKTKINNNKITQTLKRTKLTKQNPPQILPKGAFYCGSYECTAVFCSSLCGDHEL